MDLKSIGTSGSFEMVARFLEFISSVKWRPLPHEVQWERRDSFPDEAGIWTLLSVCGGKTGALLELWRDPRCSSRAETGMSGNFLSCLKSAKDPFEAQEGRRDFSHNAAMEKGLI